MGISAGFLTTSLLAVTVSGLVHVFSPDQAISSSQVNENFASLKTAIEGINTTDTYSTTETATNKVWIDGKTIYRKVINMGALGNNVNTVVAHGASIATTVEAVIIGHQGGLWSVYPTAELASNTSLAVSVDNTNITLRPFGDYTGYTAHVILEYTKP